MQKSKLLYKPDNHSSDNLYIKNIEAIEVIADNKKYSAVKITVSGGRVRKLACYYYYIPFEITQRQAENLVKNRDYILSEKMCLKPLNRVKMMSKNIHIGDVNVIDNKTSKDAREAFEKMMDGSLIIYERL